MNLLISEELLLEISPVIQAAFRFLALCLVAPGGLMLFLFACTPSLFNHNRRELSDVHTGDLFALNRNGRAEFLFASVIMASIWTHDTGWGISLAGPVSGAFVGLALARGRIDRFTGSASILLCWLPLLATLQADRMSVVLLSTLPPLATVIILSQIDDPCDINGVVAYLLVSSSIIRTVLMETGVDLPAFTGPILLFVAVLSSIFLKITLADISNYPKITLWPSLLLMITVLLRLSTAAMAGAGV